jgi:hypothetical protein
MFLNEKSSTTKFNNLKKSTCFVLFIYPLYINLTESTQKDPRSKFDKVWSSQTLKFKTMTTSS